MADFTNLYYGFVLFGIYFLPTIVATTRNHHNQGPILVINLFLGWTFIGWVIALAMATSSIRRRTA
jgi:hypothetical protein